MTEILTSSTTQTPPVVTGPAGNFFGVRAQPSPFGGVSADAGVLYLEGYSGVGPYVSLTEDAGFFTLTLGTAETVVIGTNISVHRIAALRAGGMTTAEILLDYPTLTRAKIESAIAQARLSPYYGKPYPTKTLKHFLRKGTFRRLRKELAEIEAE